MSLILRVFYGTTAEDGSDLTGDFLVAWTSQGQDGSGYGVFGQRYGLIVPVELTDFGIE